MPEGVWGLKLLEDALSVGQGLEFGNLDDKSKHLGVPAGRVFFFFFALWVFLLVVLCMLSM